MKIKVGGVYKARNGERVEIVGFTGDKIYQFDADSGDYYTSWGSLYDYKEHQRDLISEWQDEPATGQWIGWNGGECPVHPETVVEVTYGECSDKRIALVFDWDHDALPIIAYRVIKEHKEPREFWVFTNGHGDTCVSKTWRREAIHVREVLDD